jgi:serine/threonine-protein kinase HipA
MRKLGVYRNKEFAGMLTEVSREAYVFEYDEAYYKDSSKPPISLTIPKSQKEFNSSFLFPCFFNMLSEGVNRQLQCRLLKIDEQDHFGLLSATAQYDTIGAITVKPIEP